MKRYLTIVLMIAVIAFGIGIGIGFVKDKTNSGNENSIEGTYSQESGPDTKPDYVWIFNKDGSLKVEAQGYYAVESEGDNNYLLLADKKSKLELDDAENPYAYYRYLIQNEEQASEFRLTNIVKGEPSTYGDYFLTLKEGTNGLDSSNAFEGSYDRYNENDELFDTFEFHDDGTYKLVIEPVTYKIENEEMTIEAKAGNKVYGYTKSEDGSSITLKLGEQVLFILKKVEK